MSYSAHDIDRLQAQKNLTDEQFADALGISRELLNKMRRGKLPISRATKILLRQFEESNSERNTKKDVKEIPVKDSDHANDLIYHLKEANADLRKEKEELKQSLQVLEKKVLECLGRISILQERAYWFELQAHDMIMNQFDPDGKKNLVETFYISAVRRWQEEIKKGSLTERDS